MFNRQIFYDHETNDEHNKIIRLNYNLHVYPTLLCETAKEQRAAKRKYSFAYFCPMFAGL